jgi:hypothetical protein
VPAVPESAHDPERGEDLHQRIGGLVGAVVLQRQREQPVVDTVEALGLVRFPSECLDDLRAGEAFVEQDVELGDLLLRSLVDPVQPAPDGAHGDAHEREDDQRDEGQPPLADEHHGDERDDHGHLPHGHDHDRGGHARQAIDVGDDARHQVGGVHVGEEGQRHLLDVPVERATQGGHDPFADGGHHVRLPIARGGLDEVGAEEHERQDAQHRDVAPDEDVVHGGLHEPGDGAFHGGHDQRQHAAEHEGADVGAEIDEQAAIDPDDPADHARPRRSTSRR